MEARWGAFPDYSAFCLPESLLSKVLYLLIWVWHWTLDFGIETLMLPFLHLPSSWLCSLHQDIYSSPGAMLDVEYVEKKDDWQGPCFKGAHSLVADIYSKRTWGRHFLKSVWIFQEIRRVCAGSFPVDFMDEHDIGWLIKAWGESVGFGRKVQALWEEEISTHGL